MPPPFIVIVLPDPLIIAGLETHHVYLYLLVVFVFVFARLSMEAMSKLCHHKPFIVTVFAFIVIVGLETSFMCNTHYVFVFARLSSKNMSHRAFIVVVFALVIGNINST